MVDHARSHSHSHDLFRILGFRSIRRAYRSFISKCYPDKNSRFSKNSTEKRIRSRSTQERIKSITDKNPNLEKYSNENEKFDDYMVRSPKSKSPKVSRTMSDSRLTSQRPSRLMRSTSRLSQTAIPQSIDRRNILDSYSGNLRRMDSRNFSSVIMYSKSNGVMKPPPMEMQLECTLEELCFGCMKKIRFTKDAIKDGKIIQEDEVLAIKVKPGWRKGTKITFEGRGDEMPGAAPADVIFVIEEKHHQMFIREGDDLGLGVEIPLVDALTGCNLSVPLLGGHETCLEIDDIIYPGYEKILTGQGMPMNNEPEKRGNMRITFLVEFPDELTEGQKSDIVNILKDTSYYSPTSSSFIRFSSTHNYD